MSFIEISGRRIEYARTPAPASAPTIVFLHEGLGSVAQWRGFPAAVARITGCGTLVYGRLGHGGSDPAPGPRTGRYLHEEALDTLPAVLARFEVDRPVLFGHSDGASIALIYAAHHARETRGLVLEAAHVVIEDRTVAGLEEARRRFADGSLRERLARVHGPNADRLFAAWSGAWLSPAFQGWNQLGDLTSITCPVLVIQGEDDQYGTLRQVDLIADGTSGRVETLVLPACGHAPHRERPGDVLTAVQAFVAGLARAPEPGRAS